MMTTRRAFLVAVMAAAALGAGACGVKDRSAASMELAEARLTVEQADGARHELALAASGAVTWDGKPRVTISKGGSVSAGKQLIAKMDRHGAVLVGGQPTNLVVTRDGALQLDGQDELTIGRDGAIGGSLIDTMDHPAVNLDGAKLTYTGPPGARQALLLGFATVIIPSLTPAAPPAAPPAPR